MELAPKIHFTEKPLKRLNRYLQPGEKLLWHGKPSRGIRRLERDKKRVPSTLFLCGIIAFSTAKAVLQKEVSLTDPSTILSILILLYFLFGRFVVRIFKRKQFYYGITDQRVIIMGKDTMDSFPYPQITELSVERHKGHIGTVFLTPPIYIDEYGKEVESEYRPCLLFVPHSFLVYDLIKAQKELFEQTTLSDDT